jgi:hypothetical protein
MCPHRCLSSFQCCYYDPCPDVGTDPDSPDTLSLCLAQVAELIAKRAERALPDASVAGSVPDTFAASNSRSLYEVPPQPPIFPVNAHQFMLRPACCAKTA